MRCCAGELRKGADVSTARRSSLPNRCVKMRRSRGRKPRSSCYARKWPNTPNSRETSRSKSRKNSSFALPPEKMVETPGDRSLTFAARNRAANVRERFPPNAQHHTVGELGAGYRVAHHRSEHARHLVQRAAAIGRCLRGGERIGAAAMMVVMMRARSEAGLLQALRVRNLARAGCILENRGETGELARLRGVAGCRGLSGLRFQMARDVGRELLEFVRVLLLKLLKHLQHSRGR